MTTTVLLLTPDPAQSAALAAVVQAAAPELTLLTDHRALDDAQLAAIDVVLGWRLPPGLAGRLTRLRWVCSMAAGVEKLLVPDLAPGVPMSRVVDPEQALGISQYVALMCLRHARTLPLYEAQQMERRWTRHPLPAARHRIGMLGWGEVGRAAAAPLQALGFEVAPWRRDSGALHALLGRCQIVVIALPLTPETSGLLDAAAFAAMPRGAYLINVARGGHIVETDLIAAVQSGHLAGAALDVQQHEPLPADDPLWGVPGITITPHIAAQPSHETVARQFVAGLRCLQAGRPLPNAVDRGRGY
ncbi:glyoxylate/hydroxypyruvate reductase A [Aquincola sp. S2]|uniref:Glyoxylate/hydroxypyruvate reductase A n=1 Tax=Pseudaquabacterium terrae TaxID=2732868 RepID=A0ABX2EKY0_9BURK|nr:NAD(P)-dependent oxidoreductase [Aquabacterium terrae]NRF69253.1 glyoxylate/hydroxypyruvate reductase A [Aquabacterium terrae]